MPWQQMWLSSDSDLDYDALRKENNWSVCFCWWYFIARVYLSVSECFNSTKQHADNGRNMHSRTIPFLLTTQHKMPFRNVWTATGFLYQRLFVPPIFAPPRYTFIPHKHTFEIAQRANPNLSYLTDCCHTIITRWPLQSFSVIGDVYRTLFALKSPKTLLGIKRIVSLLKIFSWKPSFSKKSGRLIQVFTLLLSHNNLLASSKFFSHWRCLSYFIYLEIPQNFARNKKNCIFDKDLVLKAKFLKKIWPIDMSLHTVVVTE